MTSSLKNFLIGTGIFFLLATLFWLFMSDFIVWGYSFITFKIYSFIPLIDTTDSISLLRKAGRNAHKLNISDFAYLVNETGRIYLPFYTLISLYFIYKVIQSPYTRFTRKFTITSLAQNIVRRSPSSAFILKRYEENEKQLLNYTDEVTAPPLNAEEFAGKHGLIDQASLFFNKATADKVFLSQINFESNKNGILQLAKHEAVLASVFVLARYFTDYDNAIRMLYKLNMSCLGNVGGLPDFSVVATETDLVTETEQFKGSQQGYCSSRTYLYALFDHDLCIPPAHFRWLKAIDRTLWMALTSAGRGKKFVEGAGVIAYSVTETWLKNKGDNGLKISPSVRSASNGLEKELFIKRLIKNYEPKISTGKFRYINELESVRFKTKVIVTAQPASSDQIAVIPEPVSVPAGSEASAPSAVSADAATATEEIPEIPEIPDSVTEIAEQSGEDGKQDMKELI